MCSFRMMVDTRSSVTMQIKEIGMPRSRSLERGAAELSQEARKRLAGFAGGDYIAVFAMCANGCGRFDVIRTKSRDDAWNRGWIEFQC